jgi:holliday junction DNA helicase RuvB
VVFPKDSLDRERIVSAAPVDDDASFELKLRPQRLREFIGQDKVKNNLEIAIQAAKSRGDALDHVLLYGPPGLGKTTLANIIANELGATFQQTSGPTLQIKGDLTAILTNLRDKQVLFIDEVHRMQPALEELLYSALEDYKLDIIIGQGPSARTHTMEVKPFTFIGATTRAGLLSAPLRSRFGIVLRLEFYTHEDLKIILERSADILGVAIDAPAAMEIASRCRGTPRIANRLLRRVRDYAQVKGTGKIDKPTAQAALEMLEVDRHGFDEIDRKLLLTIIEKYQGGPVGLKTLAASLAEEPDAIAEIYEPFLIQIGFLNRKPSGREATNLAYEYFGKERSRVDRRGQWAYQEKIVINDAFIREWEPRYDRIAGDEPEYRRLVSVVARDIGSTGTVSKETFLAIWSWKGAMRVIGQVHMEVYETRYAEAFRRAVLAPPDRRLYLLLERSVKLPGVGAPTGSTLLHFMDPQTMPIIDVRTVEVLFAAGLISNNQRDLEHYEEFRQAIYGIRARCPSWTLRQIDRALFAYHTLVLDKGSQASTAADRSEQETLF